MLQGDGAAAETLQGRGEEKPKGTEQQKIAARGRSGKWDPQGKISKVCVIDAPRAA